MITTSKVVAYYRVSTKKQGESGLGLEAQQHSVKMYCQSNNLQLYKEFTEVESGAKDNRPKLEQALKYCRLTKSTLVIARLDRLSRKVSFLSSLMDSKVKFIACDNPNANELTIHILAAVAEDERKTISKRVKAALQAAKARGVKLGGKPEILRQFSEAHQPLATQGNINNADRFASDMQEVFETLSGSTLQQKSNELNELGFQTRTGKQWSPMAVRNCIKRIEDLNDNK